MNLASIRGVRGPLLCGGLALLLLLLALASLSLGSTRFPLERALISLMAGQQDIYSLILLELRLARTLTALVVGASLGLCGAALQGLLRNPLASPGLLGSSSGAALCAVVVLYFGLHSAASWLLPLAGMAGALIATLLVWLIAGHNSSITTVILAGVAVNAACAAGISLAINLAPSPWAVSEIALWLLGDLSKTSLDGFWLMLPFSLLGWLLLAGCGNGLNALSLGEQTARSMGVNLQRLRIRLFIATALAVGAAVATVGSIGFVGLVVPHLLRPLVGYEPARLLPASAFGGALMLLLADIGVRLINTQTPLQVGVLTALVGAPFFLFLILKSRREML